MRLLLAFNQALGFVPLDGSVDGLYRLSRLCCQGGTLGEDGRHGGCEVDFLDDPQNLTVNWDMTLTSKLNKFFSTNIKTNLIYDDDILIEDSKGVAAPRIQFKEIFTFGFSYTFGEFKK